MMSVPPTNSPSWASSPLTTGAEVPTSIQPGSTLGAESTSEPNPNSISTGTHLGARAIAGIAVGAFVFCAIFLCLIWRRIRNKRKRRARQRKASIPYILPTLESDDPDGMSAFSQLRAQRPTRAATASPSLSPDAPDFPYKSEGSWERRRIAAMIENGAPGWHIDESREAALGFYTARELQGDGR
ncbi:hypothetical protein F4859DRAFT_67412 [Xylaria cf. heliscus]|nr:hypothetical protein F4859DRAFT_67412 [Xylaria cf. heliscus]